MEKELWTQLLFSHKHLWTALQEQMYLRQFPDAYRDEVHGRFVDAADEAYHSLEEALLSGQPVQDALQTVLLAAELAMTEGKQV